MAACLWNTLPTELQLHTIGFLPPDGVKTLSEVSSETYALCVPTLFRNVTLNSYETVSSFRRQVPKAYYHHIRSLSICVKPSPAHRGPIDQTSALVDILSSAERVEYLSLHFIGSPAKTIIPSFRALSDLRSLHIANCGDENSQPLSERLVVSIALGVPKLRELTLDRVTRSQVHAPDLFGTLIPTVIGDTDIEDHPDVGSALSLPSLLRISTLQQLRIRDTHLGDRQWESVTCRAQLSVLDLGSCCHVSPEDGRTHVEAIVRNIAKGSPVSRLAIASGLEQTEFQHPTTPLNRLRHVELTSFFPIDGIVDTLSTLAGSPIETIAAQCFNDDVEDLCESIETFLNKRVERDPNRFHQQLKKLFIALVPLEGDEGTAGLSSAQLYEMLEEGQRDAIRKLGDFCSDLGLECGVLGISISDSSCTGALGFGPRHTTASARGPAQEATITSKAMGSPCF